MAHQRENELTHLDPDAHHGLGHAWTPKLLQAFIARRERCTLTAQNLHFHRNTVVPKQAAAEVNYKPIFDRSTYLVLKDLLG